VQAARRANAARCKGEVFVGLRFCGFVLVGLLSIGTAAAAQEPELDQLPLPKVDGYVDLVPSIGASFQRKYASEKSSPQRSAQGQQQGTSNDRILWTLPNFLTLENAHNVPPLSPEQKFKVTARGLFDPFEFVLVGFVAGLDQAGNSNPSYGQGMKGYGKRYATAYGDNLIENFAANAALPSVLHQDPRYYQLGHGGFLRRSWHAVSRVVITRSDHGQTQPNYSELGGAMAAAAISTYSYHPQSERGLGNVVSVWGTQMAWDAATYVIKEFWPDLRKRSKRHRDLTASAQPATIDASRK
jgi:hypothetical protein